MTLPVIIFECGQAYLPEAHRHPLEKNTVADQTASLMEIGSMQFYEYAPKGRAAELEAHNQDDFTALAAAFSGLNQSSGKRA